MSGTWRRPDGDLTVFGSVRRSSESSAFDAGYAKPTSYTRT